MKKLLRSLKKSQAAPAPRALEEIQKEYQQLSANAGQVQYQRYVLAMELERLNKRLVEVNQEAAYRQKLDADTKETAGASNE